MNIYKKLLVVVFVGFLCHLPMAGAAITCVVNKATGLVDGGGAGRAANPECNTQSQVNVMAGMLAGQDIEESEGTKIIGGTIITNAPKLSDVVAEAGAAKLALAEGTLKKSGALNNAKKTESSDEIGSQINSKLAINESAGSSVKRSAVTNSVAPVGVKIEAVLAAPEVKEVWTLTAGHTVGQDLQTWGTKAGWKVIWSMSTDWTIPASTSFPGDFHAAASDVIKTLAANGALVRAQFYDGNKTMVVTGPGAAAQ